MFAYVLFACNVATFYVTLNVPQCGFKMLLSKTWKPLPHKQWSKYMRQKTSKAVFFSCPRLIKDAPWCVMECCNQSQWVCVMALLCTPLTCPGSPRCTSAWPQMTSSLLSSQEDWSNWHARAATTLDTVSVLMSLYGLCFVCVQGLLCHFEILYVILLHWIKEDRVFPCHFGSTPIFRFQYTYTTLQVHFLDRGPYCPS